MKITLTFYFIFACGFIFCQSNFSRTEFSVHGDLNKDGLEDLVIVKADTIDSTQPYLLEIFFQSKTKSMQQVFSSSKTLNPKFPDGPPITYSTPENIEIKKGVLIITNGLIRSTFTHKFRYQNGDFYLIGFSYGSMDPGCVKSVDFNLSTGQFEEICRAYETNKILKKIKTVRKIRPLPKLSDFSPLDVDY